MMRLNEMIEKALQTGIGLVVVGLLIGLGIRLAEWAVPQPSVRVMICTPADYSIHEECRAAGKAKRT